MHDDKKLYRHIHQQIKTDKNVVERHAVRLDMHRHLSLLHSTVNIWTHLTHLTSDVKENKRLCKLCGAALTGKNTTD